MVVAGTKLIDPDLDTAREARAIAHADDQRPHAGERGIAEDGERMGGMLSVGAREGAVE